MHCTVKNLHQAIKPKGSEQKNKWLVIRLFKRLEGGRLFCSILVWLYTWRSSRFISLLKKYHTKKKSKSKIMSWLLLSSLPCQTTIHRLESVQLNSRKIKGWLVVRTQNNLVRLKKDYDSLILIYLFLLCSRFKWISIDCQMTSSLSPFPPLQQRHKMDKSHSKHCCSRSSSLHRWLMTFFLII